jgi:cellulose synthase/poly-beta-1,6-N-acetylglucosamine synthase-like glycosyltransferase
MLWQAFILIIYFGALLFIFGYGLSQVGLVRKSKRFFEKKSGRFPLKQSPQERVCIQLPIYNERYVVERLLDQVVKIKWPAHLLDIQILDDSTDETRTLIDARVAKYQKEGIPIRVVRRENREGFKAGALAYGLLQTEAEYIAIFDADFLPPADFLLRMMPGFNDEQTGVMQGRWGHLNEDYSLLTGLQAFGLDAHFFVEHPGRMEGEYFLNFNGTAGIWRRRCIEEAGGWLPRTLTEDLDLSYRAQMQGWKIKYIPEMEVPAELPITMPAIRSQQFRWTKGAAECSRLLLQKLWASGQNLGVKIQGSYHLLNSTVFIAIVLSALSSVPLLFIRKEAGPFQVLIDASTFFIIGYVFLAIFYFTGFKRAYPQKSLWIFIPRMIMLLALFLGLSMHNALAVLEGWMGIKSPFVRTPKFNAKGKKGEWKSNTYSFKRLPGIVGLEFLLCLYFIAGIVLGFQFGDYALMPFHALLSMGHALVVVYSIRHR